MHARIVGVAYLRRAQIDTGQQSVYNRRLAHSAVSAEQGDAVAQHLHELIHALTGLRRHGDTLVSHCLIKVGHHPLIAHETVVEQVCLVEHEHHGHTVGFGGGKETVDERRACLRTLHRNDEKRLVYVGCDDVALLAQVLRFAYDVVLAVAYGCDECRVLAVELYLHMVAHSHRIGAADAFQTEVSLYLALHNAAFDGLHRIPAAGILYH